MNKFKLRLARFMQGRYGGDDLSNFLSVLALPIMLLALFTNSGLLQWIWIILLVVVYYRILSRNISRRYAENQRYIAYKYKVVGYINRFKARLADNKTHRIYRCPSCGQKIRVPRGKGRISIKCPKCRIEFIKVT